MTRKSLQAVLLAATVAIMAVFTSCKSRDNSRILSSIPESSTAVASVDGKKLAKALDCRIEDGKVVLSPQMEKSLGLDAQSNPRAVEIVSALAGAIDIENLFFVVNANQKMYATFIVSDMDKFSRIATEEMEMTEATATAPFTKAYSSPNGLILLKEDQAWYTDNTDSGAEMISAELKAADSASMAQAAGVNDKLSDDDDQMIRLAIHSSKMPSAGVPTAPVEGAEWLYCEIDVDDNAIEIESTSYNKEGNNIEAKGMKKIDTDFLRYVPGSWDFVLAMGLSKDFDWTAVFNAIGQSTDFQGTLVLEMLKPYLRAIDGTVAIAGNIPSPSDIEALQSGNFSVLNLMMMVRMDQAKVNEAVQDLLGLCRKLNLSYQERANGIYSLTVGGGISLDFGSVNGSLALSTAPLKPNAQNSFTKIFQGKQAAAYINIPTLAAYNPDLTFGINAKMEGSGSEGKVTIRLNGTDAPILPTLISTLK